MTAPAWLAAAAGVALLAGCNATAHHHPAVTHTATHTAAPAPSYDLAGFLHTAAGPATKTMQTDLGHISRDAATGNSVTVLTDSYALKIDTAALLHQLRATNPPPAYRPARAHYIAGVVLMNRAATAMIRAMQDRNGLAAQHAVGLIAQAGYEVKQATGLLP